MSITISALPNATTPLSGNELVAVVQSSATRQVSVTNLLTDRAVRVGSLVSSGDVLGTTGTFSSTISAAALASSGAVSGTSGSFSGTVSAISVSASSGVSGVTGTFSGAVSVGSLTSGGAVSGTTGTFTGNISAALSSFVNGTTGSPATNITYLTNQAVSSSTVTNSTTVLSGGLLNARLLPGNVFKITAGSAEVNAPTAIYAIAQSNTPRVATDLFFNETVAVSGYATNNNVDGTVAPSYTGQGKSVWAANFSVNAGPWTTAQQDCVGVEVDVTNQGLDNSSLDWGNAGFTQAFWAQADCATGVVRRNGAAFAASAANGSGWVYGFYSTSNFSRWGIYLDNQNTGGGGMYLNLPTGSTSYGIVVNKNNATNLYSLDASGNGSYAATVKVGSMTTAQKNTIASPAAGMLIFDTTLAKMCVYSGAAWQTITSV